MKNIYDQQIAAGRILAMMPQWKRKEQKALDDIREMLRRCSRPYVSLSWGKQSTCLMHMVYRIAPSVDGWFFREVETDIIADFNSVIEQFLEKWPINYHEEMAYNADIEGTAKRIEQKNGYCGVFFGFARHESKGRRFTLAKADEYNVFEYANGFLRSTPLRFWTDEDIAAYVATYDLPMLNLYHRFGFHTRTSAGLTLGTHAEVGFDQMTPEQRHQILEVKRGCY